ncbi:MAG: LicD family protein [Bacteroides sp.]|nr:LicD family protein [Bacteroides sp.]MCM1447845.1 LicD family protein [Bacteroides sp.]
MENRITIKDLHALFLDMIKKFHSYCVENGLTYYMVGGTLLGAVRNHGFIPWDDDVDFAMPRPDYEKFIDKCSIFRIEHSGRSNAFLFPYAKVFPIGGSILKIKDDEWNINGSVFLTFDLYPIDGVGTNELTAMKHASLVQKIRKLCYLNMSKDRSRNFFKRTFVGCVRIIPSHWFLKLQSRLMSRYDYHESGFITRWRMPSLPDNVVPKETFEPAVLLSFEDTQLYAPAKYDWYLRKVYGDYLHPVRENEGLRHDSQANEISNLLTEYLNEI